MSTIPFPRAQTFKAIRPGSYIALSKTALPDLPALHPVKRLTNGPGWLVALARRLNQALIKLNDGILEANRCHARNKSCAGAVIKIKSALASLDKDLVGVHWPPVRPPFSERRPGEGSAESGHFPLKLQPDAQHGGHVTFHCDITEDTQIPQLASWGCCVRVGIVYYTMGGGGGGGGGGGASSSSSVVCDPGGR